MQPITTDTIGSGIRVEHIRPMALAPTRDVHRHEYYELLFLLDGSGTHMIDLAEHPVSPSCMHLVSPGQVHALQRSNDARGVVVVFDRTIVFPNWTTEDIRTLYHRPSASPVLPISDHQLVPVLAMIQLLEDECALVNAGIQRTAMSLLAAVLAKCAACSIEAFPELGSGKEDDIVRRFVQEVDTDFATVRSPHTYADRYAISVGYLSKRTHERLGRTAGEVIQDRCMLEAKRLLLHSSLSAKEVAAAIGFEDPAYFSRLFKQVHGLSPLDFRKQIRLLYKA